MATARYEVEITGIEPPYKWRLLRRLNQGSHTNLGDGQADTREECELHARKMAEEKERQRQLENSVLRVHLFTIDDDKRKAQLAQLEQALQQD